jgi:hypothetical protein
MHEPPRTRTFMPKAWRQQCNYTDYNVYVKKLPTLKSRASLRSLCCNIVALLLQDDGFLHASISIAIYLDSKMKYFHFSSS